MKRGLTTLLALVLSLMIAPNVLAQGGRGFGRGGGMMGGGLSLLGIPEVQKELKMTPEQIEKAKTKQADMRQVMMEIFQQAGDFRQLSPEDRQKVTEKMQAAQKKAIGEVLNADQQKRMNQLELQQQGTRAFGRKEVAESLKITDEQKEQLQKVQEAQQVAMREAMQGIDFQNMTDEDRTKMRTTMEANQKATTEKSMAVLTEEQKKKWKEMTGEPFKFPPMGPGGFGGPGGGQRRPRNQQ